ncbi:MAG: hypothetical protein R3B70_35935 [Polyangiaceae bacterium]
MGRELTPGLQEAHPHGLRDIALRVLIEPALPGHRDDGGQRPGEHLRQVDGRADAGAGRLIRVVAAGLVRGLHILSWRDAGLLREKNRKSS